jgi:hypothetical protein
LRIQNQSLRRRRREGRGFSEGSGKEEETGEEIMKGDE